LAELTGAKEVVMAFVSEELVTALVTTHLPLAKVAKSISPELVCATTFWLARLLLALDSSRAPQLAIASLNPHAGESGLLGREELDAITPGIELARKRLRRAKLSATLTGPIGAETAFRKASSRLAPRSFDGVVAMYHDQATIPSKVLSFGEAVNVTLGLPLVRTSVDHGTGYDVAWQGTADPSGMVGAIELAERLVRAGLVRAR
jgi:4-hydroxythreonine-4-phosphate dehydrogenase